MDAGLSTLNEELSELQSKLMEKEKQIDKLHMKHLYLESYSRCENLNFWGIPEPAKASAEEGGEAINTRAVLYEFLKTTLGFEDPRRIVRTRNITVKKAVKILGVHFTYDEGFGKS